MNEFTLTPQLPFGCLEDTSKNSMMLLLEKPFIIQDHREYLKRLCRQTLTTSISLYAGNLAKTTSGVGWRFGGGSGASLIGLGCFGFLDSQCCSSRQLLPVLLVSFFRAAMP